MRQRLCRPDERFHDHGHGCATTWLASREHSNAVHDLLIFDSIALTADVANHVVLATHREAAACIGRPACGCERRYAHGSMKAKRHARALGVPFTSLCGTKVSVGRGQWT